LKAKGEGPTVYAVVVSLLKVAHGATQSASGAAVAGAWRGAVVILIFFRYLKLSKNGFK
jgi:hypothetical protein